MVTAAVPRWRETASFSPWFMKGLADRALRGPGAGRLDVAPEVRVQRGLLLEEIVHLRVPRRRHRALEEERQPLLRAGLARPPREIGEDGEVHHDGRREDRVAALEVHLDVHRVAEPPEDVDGVPTFLVVAARRVVVDGDLVLDGAVELRVLARGEDLVEHAELRDLLRL